MPADRPLVTIGMCVYNGEAYLTESLQSALGQTYPHLEIIVFNDGSTDATRSILAQIQDPRFRLVDSERNYGVGYARQVVKEMARGDYFTWLDCDDVYHPDRIERLLEHALRTRADLSCDVYRFMDHSGALLDRYYRIPDKVLQDPHCTRLFERNVMIPHPLISRRCLERVQYDPQLKVSDDYDLWLQCSYQGFTFSRLDQVKLHYRLSPNSLSSNLERSRLETRLILSKYRVQDLVELYRSRGYPKSSIHYMLCLQYIFREDFSAALPYARLPWPAEEDIDRNFYLGTLLLLQGELAEAGEYLLRHLRRHPLSPAGYNNLGVLYRKKGEPARELFDKALQLLPEYRDAAKNLQGEEAITPTQIRL